MNQGGSGQNNNRTLSFLEELRSRQAELGTQETGYRPFSNGIESLGEKKRREDAARAEYLANRRKEEIQIFSNKDTAEEKRILEIQEEFEVISRRKMEVLPEVRKEMIKKFIKPGIYHQSFIDRWKKLYRDLRMPVGEAKSWKQVRGGRQKDLYSARAKTGGTKYTQSIDLNVARSVG